jgi:hypothetical protein
MEFLNKNNKVESLNNESNILSLGKFKHLEGSFKEDDIINRHYETKLQLRKIKNKEYMLNIKKPLITDNLVTNSNTSLSVKQHFLKYFSSKEDINTIINGLTELKDFIHTIHNKSDIFNNLCFQLCETSEYLSFLFWCLGLDNTIKVRNKFIIHFRNLRLLY